MTNTTQKWLSRLWSIFVALTIGLMLLGFTSCSPSNEPEPDDPKSKLYATWHVGSTGYLKKDGTVVTGNYAGFEVTFSSDGKYTSKNAGLVFKPAGTFSWSGEAAELFKRDQNVTTQVAVGDNGALQLTFQLDAYSVSGRQAATVGNWEIFLELKK